MSDKPEVTNEQMLAAICALPSPDLLAQSTIDSPLGSDTYYSARTVAGLLHAQAARIAELEEAMRLALDALNESVDLVKNEVAKDWRHGIPSRAGQLAGMQEGADAHVAAIEAAREVLAEQPIAAPDVAAKELGFPFGGAGCGGLTQCDMHDDESN